MAKKKHIHFIGIGGIGMSALARYFLSQKSSVSGVSGSDSTRSLITDSLLKEGVRVKIGQKKGNLPASVDLVVVTQAIPAANPELKEARRRGVQVLTYPKAVGELTKQYRTIAVAGAHGKSTTTALAALTLIAGGLDPTVIVGANLKEFGGKNFRPGKSGWLVLEADEFGRAFLHYSPFIAIATNIDREHLDVYKNLAGAQRAFLAFFGNVLPGGAIIVNRDDKNLFSLRAQIETIAKRKKAKLIWYSTGGSAKKMAAKIKCAMQIPGEHNVSNATAVYALGRYLKIPEKKIITSLGSYRGSWRRYEYKGETKIKIPRDGAKYAGVAATKSIILKVFDDYAHHPTELRATLRAYKEKFPGSPIICIFQPHQAERLRLLFKDFISCFTDADILILIPSYQVAGRESATSPFTAEKLAGAIKKKYPERSTFYLKNPAKLKEFLTKILGTALTPNATGRILIMMGAGDIVNYTPSLLQ